MLPIILLLATLALLGVTLRALRLLPGHARDQWHHAYFALVTVGYLLGRLPWRWARVVGDIIAGFGLLCVLDDAIQHGVQAYRYDRATAGADKLLALMYRSPLHLLARRLGLI